MGKIKLSSVYRQFKIYFIMVIAVIAFVFLGVASEQLGTGKGVVASVNQEIITLREFSEALQRNTQNNTNPQFRAFFAQIVLQRLIQSEVILQNSQKEHIYVPPRELYDQIVAIPAFQENGRFNEVMYSQYLERTRQTGQKLERLIMKDITQQNMLSLFKDSLAMSDVEKDLFKKLSNFQIRLNFIKIKKDDPKAKELESLFSQEGKEKMIQQYIKKSGWIWKTSKPFSLSSRNVPGIASKEALNGSIDKLIANRTYSLLFHQNHYYVLSLGSKKTINTAFKAPVDFVTQGFGAWLEQATKASKVVINQDIDFKKNLF